ncbi:MAG: hypothetical protein A4E56_03316 [Pelotomaculum sp. PtaU1.Bin065]|nr:MAG: hypothetical protein A4E56_03316 [Pelotomaculum sp. PtaU1.Bin065]
MKALASMRNILNLYQILATPEGSTIMSSIDVVSRYANLLSGPPTGYRSVRACERSSAYRGGGTLNIGPQTVEAVWRAFTSLAGNMHRPPRICYDILT